MTDLVELTDDAPVGETIASVVRTTADGPTRVPTSRYFSPQWAALTAIADQAAGHDYGFINSALYKTGQNGATYASAFNDVTSGNNSALELDSDNNEVDISGFDAGTGWDAVTGLGSPKAGGLLSQLAANWSAGQGTAAIIGSSHG